jgi:hypothetical protein
MTSDTVRIWPVVWPFSIGYEQRKLAFQIDFITSFQATLAVFNYTSSPLLFPLLGITVLKCVA